MTRYYLYIFAGSMIDLNTKFYRVAAGSSKQGLQDLEFLTNYAKENFHYFSIWSKDVDDFLIKIADSLPHETMLFPLLNLKMIPVSSHVLVNALRNNVQVIPDSHISKNTSYLRSFIDTDFRIKTNLRNRKKTTA